MTLDPLLMDAGTGTVVHPADKSIYFYAIDADMIGIEIIVAIQLDAVILKGAGTTCDP